MNELHANRLNRGEAVRVVVLLTAGLMAHGLCLGARWYLDDHWQIVESEGVGGGRWWDERWLQWTYLTHWLTYRFFGMSGPAFHAVNLAIHLGTAFVLYGVGKELLRGSGRPEAAWWAALLFVVHPLGSEITNYARCRDIAWVTLFSLGACWGILMWLRKGARWLPLVALCGMGAAYSKGPGLWHFAMMAAILAAGVMSHEDLRERVLKRWRYWAGGGVVLGVLFVAGGSAGSWWKIAAGRMEDPRFEWHLLTQCRVFWELAQRFAWPVRLCSDHQIAWTLSAGDVPAWIAAAGVAAWLGAAAWLFFRRTSRLAGVCLLLIAGPILMRVLYVSNELMPEYRIYPGLPWAALLVGLLGVRLGRRGWPVFRGVLAVAVVLCVGLSARRSLVWRDDKRIAIDVLVQYPAQVRAIWQLQTRDLAEKDFRKILERHSQYYEPAAARLQAYNAGNRWGRKLDEGLFALADIGCRGTQARALAEVANSAEPGLAIMEALRLNMEAHLLTDEIFWWTFRHHRGLLYARDGRYEEALRDLDNCDVYYGWRKEHERVREAARSAGPAR